MTQAWKAAFQEPEKTDLMERLIEKMDQHFCDRAGDGPAPDARSPRVVSVIQASEAA